MRGFSPISACLATVAFVACLCASPAEAQDGIEGVARRAAATHVRPGDRIGVHFARDKSLSDTISVNERGEAVFPKIGTFNVAQFPISKLQDTLRTLYREYMRDPELEVGVLRRIVVNGEVKNPNIYFV